MTDLVLFSDTDGVATITFNDADHLNALGLAEILAMDGQLRRWRNDPAIDGVILRSDGFQAFSVGENLREMHEALVGDDDTYLSQMARATHRLIQLWANYAKPTMAVMNGITAGIAASLAMAAEFRVATELSLFSVPHCRLGLVPDAGTAFYLARCPGKIGLFLALTGMEIRAPGMLHAGLATHYVPPQDVDWVNFHNIDALSQPVPQRPLAVIQPEIDRCFGQRSVNEIVTVLQARPEQGFRDFLRELQRGSPLALALAFRHLNEAAGRSLEEVLKSSYRLNRHLVRQGDPKEGIRAQLIDQDGKPAWISDSVAAAQIDRYFVPLTAEPELYFDAA